MADQANGGSVVALTGKNCVAIASDLRLGSTQLNGQTLTNSVSKLFEITPRLYAGFPGLYTDTLTVHELMRRATNLYRMREGRTIQPQAFAHRLASLQYEHRFGNFFVSPIVAGLDDKNKPFISGHDSIGCMGLAPDYVAAGTAMESLCGMTESLWEPDLSPEQLFETISQVMLNALDRDALSGGGCVVYVIEPDKVTKRFLKTRVD